jgi:N-acetylglutamate synthase-like GNAT family acetyltransferase
VADFRLRAATQEDFPAIRRLIKIADINPSGLDWRRFVIAVNADDELLGCGQLKPHGSQVIELASIAVQPEQRGRGIARAIIEHLIAAGPRPLYLMCRSELGKFYEKWGFRALGLEEMPAYFRRLLRIFGIAAPLIGETGGVLIMELK